MSYTWENGAEDYIRGADVPFIDKLPSHNNLGEDFSFLLQEEKKCNGPPFR